MNKELCSVIACDAVPLLLANILFMEEMHDLINHMYAHIVYLASEHLYCIYFPLKDVLCGYLLFLLHLNKA